MSNWRDELVDVVKSKAEREAEAWADTLTDGLDAE